MDIRKLSQEIQRETEKIIVGKPDRIRLIIMAVLANGHVLLDDLPGVGKTTLARIIAQRTKAAFIDFSAVTSGIKEIRQVMLKAEEALHCLCGRNPPL